MHPMLWLLIGAAALIGELLDTRLFLLNVALAAFAVAALALVVGPAAQVALFVALALLLLGLVRPRLIHALVGALPRRTLTTQGRLMDRAATVVRTVTPDDGTIRIGAGEFWTARTHGPLPPIPAGAAVRIAYVDGLTAYVDPIPDPAPAPVPLVTTSEAARTSGPSPSVVVYEHKGGEYQWSP